MIQPSPEVGFIGFLQRHHCPAVVVQHCQVHGNPEAAMVAAASSEDPDISALPAWIGRFFLPQIAEAIWGAIMKDADTGSSECLTEVTRSMVTSSEWAVLAARWEHVRGAAW